MSGGGVVHCVDVLRSLSECSVLDCCVLLRFCCGFAMVLLQRNIFSSDIDNK